MDPIISIPISIIGLFIAIATFFYTHLRGSKIAFYLGPNVNLGYYDQDGASGFSITIPTTFINDGPGGDTIIRAALVLWRETAPYERYFMQWDSFVKSDFQTRKWVTDEIAHALAIAGKSTVAKAICFAWPTGPSRSLRLQGGAYKFSFHIWTSRSNRPHGKLHEIIISDDSLRVLQDGSNPADMRAITVPLDKAEETTYIMTENQYNMAGLTIKR